MSTSRHGFSTRAIHDGQAADPLTGAVNVPIYASSTYAQEEIGKHRGYECSLGFESHAAHPVLEENLASLEGGASAHVFSQWVWCGHSEALVTMLKTGDHVICGSNVYGGTPRLFDQIIANYGIVFTYVDTTDVEQVRRAIQPTTRLVHIETPTNPLMQITDIRAIAISLSGTAKCGTSDRSKRRQHLYVALLPAAAGMGCGISLCTPPPSSSTATVMDWVAFWWGPLRSTRSLLPSCRNAPEAFFLPFLVLPLWCCAESRHSAVRMKQHEVNGRAIAYYLAGHPKIPVVFYPRPFRPSPA